MTTESRTLPPIPLAGTLQAIPAKAEAHRLLIAASLADAPTLITGLHSHVVSEDIQATIKVLQAAGTTITTTQEGLLVTPGSSFPQACSVDCGESGSTLRFLLPVLAARMKHNQRISVTGHGRLPNRPLKDLLIAMEQHGATASAPALPFTLAGPLTSGTYELPGNVSSQYITGLLLALPALSGDSTIKLTTVLESRSYVNITIAVLRHFGIHIAPLENGWMIPGKQRFHSPRTLHVDGDWSNAAMWLIAGAISRPITITGLNPDSPQGDRAVLDLLKQAGAKVSQEGTSVTVAPDRLRPLTIDVSDTPDLLPVLSILAAATPGTTNFINAARLRLKESDRLAAVEQLITSLGGQATSTQDSLTVIGNGQLAGGAVSVCHDHRLVMAAVLATTISQHHITLDDAQAVNKSYPSLWEDIHTLGGH